MPLRRRRILGLAIEEHAVLAAEVSLSGSKASLTRTAELPFREALPPEDPQQLGQALRDSLRRHGFSAKSAVIGVPARWLLSAARPFPPAGPSVLASMVRIEAERCFATDTDDLVLDYAPGSAANQGREFLLTAMPRRTVDRLRAMVLAAGLKPLAMAPTSMLLAAAMKPDVPGLLLFLRPRQAEIVIRSRGRFSAVRHLSLPLTPPDHGDPALPADWRRAVAALLARTAALTPRAEDAEPDALVIWDAVGLDPEALQGVGEPLGLPTQLSAGLQNLGLAPPSHPERLAQPAVAAAALAAAGARRSDLPVDFLHSRLEVRRRPRSRRRIAWAAAAAIAVLLAAIALSAQWRADQQQVLALQQRLESMQPDIEAAQGLAERVALARRWADRRSRFLNPLKELTLAFPAEGGIWVSNLALQDDMRAVVSGKASDEQTVLDALDSIRTRPALASVRLLYLREAGVTNREVAFSLTFDYLDGGGG